MQQQQQQQQHQQQEQQFWEQKERILACLQAALSLGSLTEATGEQRQIRKKPLNKVSVITSGIPK